MTKHRLRVRREDPALHHLSGHFDQARLPWSTDEPGPRVLDLADPSARLAVRLEPDNRGRQFDGLPQAVLSQELVDAQLEPVALGFGLSRSADGCFPGFDVGHA